MKKIYALLMLLAVMLTTLTLTACGGSDEDEEGQEVKTSALVGTWKLTSSNGALVALADALNEGEESNGGERYLQFKSNGTYVDVIVDYPDIEVRRGKWLLKGSDLVVTLDDKELKGISIVYKILKLTNKELTLNALATTGTYIKVPDSTISKYLK